MGIIEEFRRGIGSMRWKLKRVPQGLRYFALAITHESDAAELYLVRAELYSRQDRFGEALDDYYRQMEVDAFDTGPLAMAHSEYAKALGSSGYMGLAMSNLAAAISLSPAAPYYAGRGDIYRELGHHAGAIADYERALELDPEDWASLDGIYLCHRAKGTLEEALTFYRELSIWKGSALHEYSVGRAYCGLGDFEGAIACLSEAIYVDRKSPVEWPGRHNPYLLRADAHYELGEYEAAVSDYNAGIAIGRRDAATFVDRGRAYQKMGDYGRALEDFERAIGLESDLIIAYLASAEIHTLMGDHGRAIGALDEVLGMYPKHDLAGDNEGRGSALP